METSRNKGASNFWILMTIGSGACTFALLYNRFYDPLPLIGLALFAGLFIYLAIWFRSAKPLQAGRDPYTIERAGMIAARIFWLLCIGGCGACIFALFYNGFYDALPVVGLVLLAGLFFFFFLATLWREKIEFAKTEVNYIHIAYLFKTRKWTAAYADVGIEQSEFTSRTKNGNYYITTTFYVVRLMNYKLNVGAELETFTTRSQADGLAQFYRDLINGASKKNGDN